MKAFPVVGLSINVKGWRCSFSFQDLSLTCSFLNCVVFWRLILLSKTGFELAIVPKLLWTRKKKVSLYTQSLITQILFL